MTCIVVGVFGEGLVTHLCQTYETLWKRAGDRQIGVERTAEGGHGPTIGWNSLNCAKQSMIVYDKKNRSDSYQVLILLAKLLLYIRKPSVG